MVFSCCLDGMEWNETKRHTVIFPPRALLFAWSPRFFPRPFDAPDSRPAAGRHSTAYTPCSAAITGSVDSSVESGSSTRARNRSANTERTSSGCTCEYVCANGDERVWIGDWGFGVDGPAAVAGDDDVGWGAIVVFVITIEPLERGRPNKQLMERTEDYSGDNSCLVVLPGVTAKS